MSRPHDSATHKGGYCFDSALCKLLGVKFDEKCMECFAAAGITFDNDARPITRADSPTQ